MRHNLLSLGAVVVILSGCSEQSPRGATHQEMLALKQEVEKLRVELSALEEKHIDEMATVRTNTFLTGIKVDGLISKTASLSPGNDGYQFVRTNGITFLVSLGAVTPFADGQRVTFLVGNPYSATFSNPTVRVRWAPRPELAAVADEGDGQRARREKEERVLTDLRPGKWTDVAVTLAPAKPEDVGQLEFEMDMSSVMLKR